MATKIAYGVQFEALMAEVCRDFGYKLVKSWEADRGMPLDKSEIRDFVAEAVTTFFSIESSVVEEEVEVEKPKKKASAKKASDKAVALDVTVEVEKPKAKPKGGKGGKGLAKKSEEPVVDEEPEAEASVKKAPAKKGKAAAKPKCQAVTAKGTPCSKCAVDGEPFCNIHMKKAPAADVVAKGKAKAPAKALASTKKKAAKASPPKHTHGLTSPPLKENPCELCDTHGMPFEVPEYEEDKASDLDAEVEMAYDPTDPDFVLGEEDFDESDSDSDMDDLD